ncbi:M81 family metallopeptidase [Lichenihabitans sp. Uapishka_5]|uniref:M81 family metallopeptidase n=1 Tax=Lichenihabitans sp. Uapishka_5 TaxID=3037302 RepID=UPI0029E8042D|nr:M81 family metallopeptidase [Lichenihabitans sp. Uapishka_5]MDX7951376.1 M81 family metallopeptidase [Lichenihabitans sp. Uapishka_5]
MKVLVTELRQESNSFSAARSGLAYWRSGWLLEPDEVHATLRTVECAVGGMIEVLERSERRPEIVFGPAFCSQSGGPAEPEVLEAFLSRLLPAIEANLPLDAVFFSFHGALQSTEFDDVEGEVVRRVRAVVPPGCVLAASLDMHGFVPRGLAASLDVICGYHTYPHVDFAETGRRTARLGLATIAGAEPPVMAWAPVPMIVSASAYNTMGGPFRDLIGHGRQLVDTGALLDFSLFQMQPWLDVSDPNSAVIAIALDAEAAARGARDLAARLYGLRHAFAPRLSSVDAVIDRAEDPASVKPVILVDSADSPNAGATGDNMAVARRLLDRRSTLRAAVVVSDPSAVRRAFEVGVGGTAEFAIGGAADPRAVTIRAEGYVRSLHDGEYRQEFVGHGGKVSRLGRSAVLRFGQLDVLACHTIVAPGDPQLFRAFGIEPRLYDLVAVKANTSFRVGYAPFAGEIIEADTPGAAAPDIATLPFRKVPKTLFPWTDDASFEPVADVIRRTRDFT